jgi:PAS domain S-box-containing protein
MIAIVDIGDIKRADESLRLRSQELEVLVHIAGTLVRPGSFKDKCTAVMQDLASIAQANLAILRVVDEEQQGLLMLTAGGPGHLDQQAAARIANVSVAEYHRRVPVVAFDSISGMVLQQGNPIVVNDYPSHPLALDATVEVGIRSMVTLPIKTGSDQILAVVNVLSQADNHFTPERVRLLTAVAEGIGTLMENARLYQQISSELEQRQEAEKALRDSEETTRLIVETAYDAFIAIDAQGLITAWNPQAETTFGWPAADVIGQPLADLIVPDRYRERHNGGLKHFLVSGEGPVLNKRLELEALDRNGREFPVELTISPVKNGETYSFNAFVHDITERRQSELALRESEERFRNLWDHAADGFFLCELSGKIVDVNQMACDISGHTREEILDLSVSDITPVTPVGAAPQWRELVPGVRVTDRGVIRRKDGTPLPVEVHFTVLESQGRKLILGSLNDITETKQAEETQRNLAVLEERNRLARELHDSVTQSLYSLTLFAEAGRRQSESGEWERVTDYLSQLGETSQQALKEMRLLVYELLPTDLEKEGLIGALQQRLDAVEGRAGVEARLIVEGKISLRPDLEACFYRVALEALNNSLKHAAATNIAVRVAADGERVALNIEDNGKGFDQEDLPDRGGMGLTSVRERTDEVGGTLVILSEPGKGTTVEITVVTST